MSLFSGPFWRFRDKFRVPFLRRVSKQHAHFPDALRSKLILQGLPDCFLSDVVFFPPERWGIMLPTKRPPTSCK